MKSLFLTVAFLAIVIEPIHSACPPTPKLNLEVRKIACYSDVAGWLFQVTNNDETPIYASDLEIRFWVYEPGQQLVGKRLSGGNWETFRGIKDGEAVMCAFLSPEYKTVASRKANYAIRYRTAANEVIEPGKSWKVRFGYGGGALIEKDDYSQRPQGQKDDCEEGRWFPGLKDDPHFCLYYRGTLVREWESAQKADAKTGIEPPAYDTCKGPAAPVPQAEDLPQINPAYRKIPGLSGPIQPMDHSKYVVIDGQYVNIAKAKQEIQEFRQSNPGLNPFDDPRIQAQNLRLIQMAGDPSASGYTYDDSGNTLTDPEGKTYTYDAKNRLLSVTADGLNFSYLYDGDNLRVSKINQITGQRVDYLWDTNSITGVPQVVEELEAGQVVRVYNYDQNGLYSVNQRISENWVTRYYGRDGQGNVRYLVDEDGNITDTYDYDAFGILLNRTGTTPNPMLFAQEYLDEDIGLYYLRSRWYAPDIGRFYTMDSYEGNPQDPLSLHKYVYSQNNPVNRVDPEGTDSRVLGNFRGILAKIFGVQKKSTVKILENGNPVTRGFTVHTSIGFYNWQNKKRLDYILEAGPAINVGIAANDYGNLVKVVTKQLPVGTTVFKEIENPFGDTQSDDLLFRTQFLRLYSSYHDDVKYWPWPFIKAHTGNSNSFTGSMVRGLGLDETGPIVPFAVGWDTEVISRKP